MAKKTKEQIERDAQIYQITTLVAGDFSLQEALDKLAEAYDVDHDHERHTDGS